MNDLEKLFRKWLTENGFSGDGEFKIWNVDTSLVTMLNTLKNGNINKLIFEGNTNGSKYNFCETNNRLKVKNFNEIPGKSFSAWHQRIRVGLFFDCFDLKFEVFERYTNISEFFKDWSDNKIDLNFKDSFFNAPSITNYILDNTKNILDNWKKIDEFSNKAFAKKDLYNILFNLWLVHYSSTISESFKFNWNSPGEYFLSIIDEMKLNNKINSSIEESYKEFFKTFNKLQNFMNVIFNNNISKNNTQVFWTEKRNEEVGYAGEFLFNTLLELKEINYVDLPEDLIKDLNVFTWVSKKNKYSDHDFKVGEYFVEVKTTEKNDKIDRFMISENELNLMESNKENFFLCFIKNIKIDEIDWVYSKENVKLFKKKEESNKDGIEIKFYNYFELKDNFNFKPKGYWVSEKK